MKYLVVSDLHVPTRNREIPDVILEEAEKCDGIFALGDFVDINTVLLLQQTNKNFFAVYGNMDEPDVKDYLTSQKIVQIGNFTIGLIHGSGSHFNIPERIKNHFDNEVNVILYGHSHLVDDSTKFGKRFINPGAGHKTYGIIEVKGDKLTFTVKKIKGGLSW
ncbi:metallophosphoesterase family protein [Thermosipho ferrireducens]|uniref:Phosphoesterase n=1 Tax=Thermosipho ferrireducens TaxID=2571116 RepID=A0ABX7SBC1_9BACT|nr:metallophosphoesterase family protein [Thermosipho ferrireducens]QTA38823.1 metallophosphoesterase family protein [Thermosipho ferrireducens]